MDNNKLFKNNYRITTARHKAWDYSNAGVYFVTICTRDFISYFGEIKNGQMILSTIGQIAKKYWQEIPKHFPDVGLDEYIIMPNHLHGIIVIKENENKILGKMQLTEVKNKDTFRRDEACLISTMKKPTNKEILRKRISPQPRSLAVIVGSFKSITTKKVRELTDNTNLNIWQPRFYDHIIWHENELNNIRSYVRNNPLKWDLDRNNLENIKNV